MSHRIVVVLLLTACGVEEKPPTDTAVGTVAGSVQTGCPDPSDPQASSCPNPNDPRVHYVGASVSKCAASLFQCTASQKTFNDSCGCGCID